MPQAAALPSESYRLFLLARRGLPLLGAAALLALAVAQPAARGWYVLGAVFLLAEIWPTFKTGKAFLAARPAINRYDGRWVLALRPLFRRLGLEEAWILSFCAWNNHRVKELFVRTKARRALVLLPHCIQMARCKADILTELSACYDCGLCDVGDLLQAQLQNGWESRITNRSHKAYREAREYQPDLIVGISCSDRLLKALIKLPDVPSYVIPLNLPHGMCVDTHFSVPHLLAAMETLVEPRAGAAEQSKVSPLRREGIA